MAYKLDLTDRKILMEIDTGSRASFSKTGRRLGIGKNNVQYRVSKLVEDGVIKKFVTQVSLAKFGLSLAKIYFQLSGYDEKTEAELCKYLLNDKRISWVAKCEGRWDLMIGTYVENILQFLEVKDDFFEKFGRHVTGYDVVFLTEGYTSQRTYLINKKSYYSKKVERFMGSGRIKFKKQDVELLKFIANNARFNYTEIAKKFRINVKTAQARIKNLEKLGIIQGYVTFLDIKKIGYNFFKLCVYTKGDKKQMESFIRYCLELPNVIHVIESVGQWEVELEIETETLQDFYGLTHQIRNKFTGFIRKTESIIISEEVKLDFFPEWYEASI
ncbi:MAG: Lrp/AsnC family transcriptional regulator [Candidatus Aenigmarchaeota archaeon]|nr:Lrp/AsnC family transcriptional regulator [Candidatus Aenigmarchaeota archaeon]